jgi:hypothetical protein
MTKDAEFIAFEKALREQIAKQIEAMAYHDNDLGMIYPNAAAIARGTK